MAGVAHTRAMRTRIDQIRRDIRTFEALAQDAAEALSFSAAVSARSKVTSLREDLARMQHSERVAKTDDVLERTRLLLGEAQQAGSYQAAARLVAVEADIVGKREALALQLKNVELEDLSEEDLVSDIVDSFDVLPRARLVEIGRALWRHLGDELPTALTAR